MRSEKTLSRLQQLFGNRVQLDVPLERYCTSRIGGPAEGLLVIRSKDELAQAVSILWEEDEMFQVFGSGANVLISEKGYRGVILINQAKEIRLQTDQDPVVIWAESGATFASVSRQAGVYGYSGLEWAVTVPGTLGGAIYGNAGAYGSSVQKNLQMAEILHRTDGIQQWSNDQMLYGYRTSVLKRNPGFAVILSAALRLEPSTVELVQEKMNGYIERRKISQPPGSSMGSTFKNPPGEHAARLIEAAGLKGTRIGGAEISQKHANFFINHEDATACDMKALIDYARETVAKKFGVNLELEIELIGDWDCPETYQQPTGNEQD